MKISDLSVSFRTAILVFVFLLTVGGLFSYITIPKEAAPDIEIPTVFVSTILPGASPEDVESLVTQPIEQEVQTINGIDELRSISTEGASIIIAEFTAGMSTNEAFQRTRDQVDQARPELPDDAEDPNVDELDFDDFPIMTINLGASYSTARLQNVAENLEEELETVEGVLEVDIIGGVEREVQVDVDIDALHGHNLTYNDLVGAIQAENTNIPGGDIDIDRQNYLVRVDGEIEDPREVEDFVVAAPQGLPIHVRDVADVNFGFKDRESYSRLRVLRDELEDGSYERVDDIEALSVISLDVKQRSGSNILETVDGVYETLDTFQFPSGTEFVITGDQSEDVQSLISDLENNIISGLIFVVLVLLFFLGVRNASLVAIAIPLSMFLTFITLQAMGVTLNFIVLFTLIVALGILVDNAIVIIENIYRFREEGYGRFEAARRGAAEFSGAITVATATTCLTFAPMLFWPGVTGEFMGFLPLTLIIALASSLFIAIIVGPALMAIFGRTPDDPRTPLPRAGWYLILGALVLASIVLLTANWETFFVLAVSGVVAVLLYRSAFKPVADWFMESVLPWLQQNHRAVLQWMLERNYDGKYAMVRNTLALGSFTLGIALLALGGAVTFVSMLASYLLLAPGALLLLIGVLGIIVHTVEALYRGSWHTVQGALLLGGIMAAVLGLAALIGRPLTLAQAGVIMLLPLAIALIGAVGGVFSSGAPLLLTDNRSLLLNGSLGTFLTITGLFFIVFPGVEFFPETDPNQVRITMEAPLGTNIDASDDITRTAEQRLERLIEEEDRIDANLENVLSNVGVTGTGEFGGGVQPQPELSRININMIDYGDRVESSANTLARVRDAFDGLLPGVTLDIQQDELGPPTGPPVNIEITGPEFTEITRITEEVRDRLEEGVETGAIEGLVDVQDNLDLGRPEVNVNIDRSEAAQQGLNTSQIAQTVRSAIAGTEASTYRDGEDDYDITVRLKPEQRADLESLDRLMVRNSEGNQVPLVTVADMVEGAGFGSITRLDLQRVSVVEGRNAPGFTGQEVLADVQDHLEEYRDELPPGYELEYTGEQEDQEEAFGFLTIALIAGIMLIFLVTVAKFNSLSAPLIILLAVGLSQIGVLFTLLISQTPFGLMVFVGIISLFGILVNNNIVLLDYIQQLRRQGLSKTESIATAGVNRLRPVLLTALTTILALVPLTFGINVDFVGLLSELDPDFQFGSENTQFWGPMGISIIGGLIFALFLTLVIVPTIFSAFESLSLRFGRLFGLDLTDENLTAEADSAADSEDASPGTPDDDGPRLSPST